MKLHVFILCLMLGLASCKDKTQNGDLEIKTEDNKTNSSFKSDSMRSNSEVVYSENQEESKEASNMDSEGNLESTFSDSSYIKNGESDCNCSCLNPEEENNIELCLSEDNIYINAKYQESGNKVNIYYDSPSNKNTNKDIPWKEFDTNTPIAVLSAGENGNIKLDWKGFSINGELAVDYAIYGKKTLEGTYIKNN
ncbi:hypothetical protein SAMN05660776_2403 [Salegentibacter holothuriorum]|uniref:Lipoprotein n=1 Tax=Salegentibacter holothuriorum TaxID=241145 RepID=A0A1T5D506_9FLAO|nr:hypothetical protein [Salegentibacter holothuriorum]SKB66775.1 hypothetical protein SAMN05660776_2403 [Salegentibacter holothuriorum]